MVTFAYDSMSRIISEVLNGQNRVLIAWQRLIMPNGNSIILEAMPGTDAALGPRTIMPSLKYSGVAPAGAWPEAFSPSVVPSRME